jgi:hypothetical protein
VHAVRCVHSGTGVLLSVQVADLEWSPGLLVMRRSGVRFPKAAHFNGLISLCVRSPWHEKAGPRTRHAASDIGDMRSRRVSLEAVSCQWRGGITSALTHPVGGFQLRWPQGCSQLPGLVPACRQPLPIRPLSISRNAAPPRRRCGYMSVPGMPCDASTPSLVRLASCRTRPSTLVAGLQQAIYFESCTAGGSSFDASSGGTSG